MADFIPSICGTNKVYVPTAGCSDCDRIYERLDAIEAMLSNKITLSQTNRTGESIMAEVFGAIVEQE